MATINTVAAPATAASKAAFCAAMPLISALRLPQTERCKEGQEWFVFCVRHPETSWAALTVTTTYGELVEAMAKVAALGVLPEGTIIRASRCYGYCKDDCSYQEQTFLRSQIGRLHHLESPRD